jgi:hypothetical protein
MSAVPNTTSPGQLPITQEKLQEVIAKSMLSTTSNGCYGQICTLKVPNPNAGGHEMRAWDGVQRGSPAEEYLKKARGGLDPVRGDTWHFQQSASVKDGVILEMEGHVVGKIVGPVIGAAGALMPIAKEAAKSAFKSASEAAVRAGRSAGEAVSAGSKAAGEAAVKTLNAARKFGVAILRKKPMPIKGSAPAGLPKTAVQKDGWPDLPAREAPNFNDASAIELTEGSKIYRIIDANSNPAGG